MSAVNFTGQADLVFSANASTYEQPRFAFGIRKQWRLDRVAGGGFALRRLVSSSYVTDIGSGGTITNSDLKDLWLGLLNFAP